ncbi:hypothetical protein NC652_022597 [Populus alba x Populus x berolinensis]|uniref:Uncharacterized protein n=1 Tax=Populus alba x Populus x berolinensis TaxID=444605 RepID=A0AAD6MEN1_9ROSI|nr:hypothetical protein NC652_022597 [Populus alba x Populus x berolinensis]KAJ6984139.1 hypothetical protein NC653_022397 [Populus alba x Populus x berolinensis]
MIIVLIFHVQKIRDFELHVLSVGSTFGFPRDFHMLHFLLSTIATLKALAFSCL